MTSKKKYTPLVGVFTNTQKVAHYLNWAAEESPGMEFSLPDVLKAALNQPRRLSESSREVDLLRSSLQRIRAVLGEQYNKGLVIVRGIGVRATKDDEDKVSNCVQPRARKVNSALNSLDKQVKLVDVSKLPATVEGKEMVAYMKRVQGILRDNEKTDLATRLLPKPRKEEDGK